MRRSCRSNGNARCWLLAALAGVCACGLLLWGPLCQDCVPLLCPHMPHASCLASSRQSKAPEAS
jgi:hypothetical protein